MSRKVILVLLTSWVCGIQCQNITEAHLQEIRTDIHRMEEKARAMHQKALAEADGDFRNLSNHINTTTVDSMSTQTPKQGNGLDGLIPKESCGAVDCNNRGTCIGTKSTYLCACSIGFSGKNCEDTICDSARDCNGRGICLGTTTTLTCLCNIGYTGKRCETLIH
ncbi:unnamed protein product [Auanema sp. JU1783]|nr:unnamed protein product [Auanema sp. JU1783]